MIIRLQRHYSQLKEELQKLKRPTDDGLAETLAANDLVPSDATFDIDAVPTVELVTEGSAPAAEMQDASGASLDASSAASVDCDSAVTGNSSPAVA